MLLGVTKSKQLAEDRVSPASGGGTQGRNGLPDAQWLEARGSAAMHMHPMAN